MISEHIEETDDFNKILEQIVEAYEFQTRSRSKGWVALKPASWSDCDGRIKARTREELLESLQLESDIRCVWAGEWQVQPKEYHELSKTSESSNFDHNRSDVWEYGPTVEYLRDPRTRGKVFEKSPPGDMRVRRRRWVRLRVAPWPRHLLTSLPPPRICRLYLEICVLGANNLVPTDINGFSDPYATVTLGKQEFKTDIAYTSLNPRWNQRIHFYVGWDALQCADTALAVCVWGYRSLQFTDHLHGTTSIPLHPVLAMGPQRGRVAGKWWELKGGDVEGEATVQVSVALRERGLDSEVLFEPDLGVGSGCLLRGTLVKVTQGQMSDMVSEMLGLPQSFVLTSTALHLFGINTSQPSESILLENVQNIERAQEPRQQQGEAAKDKTKETTGIFWDSTEPRWDLRIFLVDSAALMLGSSSQTPGKSTIQIRVDSFEILNNLERLMKQACTSNVRLAKWNKCGLGGLQPPHVRLVHAGVSYLRDHIHFPARISSHTSAPNSTTQPIPNSITSPVPCSSSRPVPNSTTHPVPEAATRPTVTTTKRTPFPSQTSSRSHSSGMLVGDRFVVAPLLFQSSRLFLKFSSPAGVCELSTKGAYIFQHSKTGSVLKMTWRIQSKESVEESKGGMRFETGPWDVIVRARPYASTHGLNWTIGTLSVLVLSLCIGCAILGILACMRFGQLSAFDSIFFGDRFLDLVFEKPRVMIHFFASIAAGVVIAAVMLEWFPVSKSGTGLDIFGVMSRKVCLEILSAEFVSHSGTDSGKFQALLDGPVPGRFLLGSPGDPKDARARWVVSCHWKRENQIARILQTQQPHFNEMMAMLPTVFHKRDKAGRLIAIQQISRVQESMQALKDKSISMSEIKRHVAFVSEYMFTHLDSRPLPEGKMLRIIDVGQVGVSDASSDVLTLVKEVGLTLGYNYPERQAIIFIINVPSFFAFVWEFIKPLIRPVTQKKIRIVPSHKVADELLKEVDPENLPREYGGKCKCEGVGGCLKNSEEVKSLAEFVHKLNQRTDTLNCGMPSFQEFQENAIRMGS